MSLEKSFYKLNLTVQYAIWVTISTADDANVMENGLIKPAKLPFILIRTFFHKLEKGPSFFSHSGENHQIQEIGKQKLHVKAKLRVTAFMKKSCKHGEATLQVITVVFIGRTKICRRITKI